jgi:hypothetical protein
MAACLKPGRPNGGHPPKGERIMRNHVRHNRSERTQPSFGEGHERDLALAAPFSGTDDLADLEDADDEFADGVRLTCPDCGQPIAVLDDEPSLPEHALCPTPWNPFGLTVCAGAGRAVGEALPFIGVERDREPEWAVLLTLPAGLDWRTQPFSHVGGPGSRPQLVPEQRLAA